MSLPAAVGWLTEPEHHGEAGFQRAAALGSAMLPADRREGALDRVGRP